MSQRELHEYTAPADWAPYLINCDSSSLEPNEIQAIQAWIDSIGLGFPLGCQGFSEFSRTHDAYRFWPYAGQVLKYLFLP